MAEIGIARRVDAALERGLDGCDLSRANTRSLMEECPIDALLETAAAVSLRVSAVTRTGNQLDYGSFAVPSSV